MISGGVVLSWLGGGDVGGVCGFKEQNQIGILKMVLSAWLVGISLSPVDGTEGRGRTGGSAQIVAQINIEGGGPISTAITGVSLTQRVCWLDVINEWLWHGGVTT